MKTQYAELLKTLLTVPGMMAECFNGNGYKLSFRNIMLGALECRHRLGLPAGPIMSAKRWLDDFGRTIKPSELEPVRIGENGRTVHTRAISLIKPELYKKRHGYPNGPYMKDSNGKVLYGRTFRAIAAFWCLAQTEGKPYVRPPLANFSFTKALKKLKIAEVPFEHSSASVQGYAKGRDIAISDLAIAPDHVRLHELGHIVLGHTHDPLAVISSETDRPPRGLRELEAEAVAMLAADSLGLATKESLSSSRAYIQAWYRDGKAVPEDSARKIIKATDAILKAGGPAAARKGGRS